MNLFTSQGPLLSPQKDGSSGFHAELFMNVPDAPQDPILGLNDLYKADRRHDTKVNLIVGEYCDAHGQLYLPPSIIQAEDIVLTKERRHISGKGYSSMAGLPDFIRLAKDLLIPPESGFTDKLNTIQTAGGTQALSMGTRFLRLFANANAAYMSDPTWGNHRAIFQEHGYSCGEYTYYNRKEHRVDFDGMLGSMSHLDPLSVVLLHGVCHNPTGSDLIRDHWDKLAEVMVQRKLIPFLDIAYQGFGAGLREDMYPVEAFAKAGLTFAIAHSFSKTLSLYGERLGTLTIVSENSHKVLEQMKLLARRTYSNPPIHGAKIAAEVLGDEALRTSWENELKEINLRIKEMRSQFAQRMDSLGLGEKFYYVLEQRGMFSLLDLNKDQVTELRERHGVYILESGRINFAGLNMGNLDYVCSSIADIIKNPPQN